VRAHTGDATEWSYTGEQNDPTGLEYLRARYYDSSTGRFIAVDPMPGGNVYAYALLNPVRWSDPSGLCIVCVTTGVATLAGGVVGVGATYVGDVVANHQDGGSFTDISTYAPRSSLRTYTENGLQGAAAGFICGAELIAGPVACAAGASFATSLVRQGVDQVIDTGRFDPRHICYGDAISDAALGALTAGTGRAFLSGAAGAVSQRADAALSGGYASLGAATSGGHCGRSTAEAADERGNDGKE
jgi:RHS repeat-associated protein